VELVPFQAAIAAGLGAIMTAHIAFPQIRQEEFLTGLQDFQDLQDCEDESSGRMMPSTLSRSVVTGLLRKEMGFDGLVITDDLVMRAVADRWGPAEAAVRAFEAGCDVLLCCHGRGTQGEIRDAVVDAVRSGRIGEERLDESLRRIERAKARWAALD